MSLDALWLAPRAREVAETSPNLSRDRLLGYPSVSGKVHVSCRGEIGKKAECEGECKVEDQKAALRREMAVSCEIDDFSLPGWEWGSDGIEPTIR